MGKILLSLALAAAFALPSFAQDIVILKDGTSVDAKVIEVDDNSVRYKKFNNPDGPTYTAKKKPSARSATKMVQRKFSIKQKPPLLIKIQIPFGGQKQGKPN